MNKQIFSIVGVSEQDYLDWCKDNKKAAYKNESKQLFFHQIQTGVLVKDQTGKLIKRKRK